MTSSRGIRVILYLVLIPSLYGAAWPAAAAQSHQPDSPRAMLARYFADLNARRYHAAWQLEAPCRTGFSISNGPGAPRGSEGWQGRGAWRPPSPQAAAHPILTSARVTMIKRLRIPILTRHHILAFGVGGRYTFDYSRIPWANMKHKNGFHVIKIALWRCHGRWGIEPEGPWLDGSGGELTWT